MRLKSKKSTEHSFRSYQTNKQGDSDYGSTQTYTKLKIYNHQTPKYSKSIWEWKETNITKYFFKKNIYRYILLEYFVLNIHILNECY